MSLSKVIQFYRIDHPSHFQRISRFNFTRKIHAQSTFNRFHPYVPYASSISLSLTIVHLPSLIIVVSSTHLIINFYVIYTSHYQFPRTTTFNPTDYHLSSDTSHHHRIILHLSSFVSFIVYLSYLSHV